MQDEPQEPRAVQEYDIVDYGGWCMVYCWTNDDEDTGYPSRSSQWSVTFSDSPEGKGLDKAKAYAGVSRIGVSGVRVIVTLDGEVI